MRQRITAVLAALGLAIPFGLYAVPAQAAPAPAEAVVALLPLVHSTVSEGDNAGNVKTYTDSQLVPTGVASTMASFPFNGWKFRGLWICQDDNIGGGAYYPTITAGNQYELGASPVTFANDQNETTRDCVRYTDAQTVHYSLYNGGVAAGNSCWKTSGTWVTENTWKLWTHVDAQINTYPEFCGNNAQRRANSVSRVTGAVLGLIAYGPTGNDDNCIMNSWYQNVYYYAGACEQGRVGWLY